MKKVNLIIKGNLLTNRISREREREREREYKNNLEEQEKTELICLYSKDFSEYDISNAIIIEGDLDIDNLLYNGIIIVTGCICVKGIRDE